ncbi:MepB protein [compost metagenome]
MNQLFPQLNELFEKLKTPITNIESDLECEAYFGCNFLAGTTKIKFRKAKITPKKIGQFVTLWRRNTKGITEPFNAKDEFDFYLIYTEKNEQHGFFLFPSRILADQQILASDKKDGKRGFRIYPLWDIPENKQAEKTKAWQSEFFTVLGKEDDMKKLISLIGN